MIVPRPETRNKQKTIADLLALGAPAETVATQVGCSVEYIRVLLRGELFQFEIDQARSRLIGERREEYLKLLSEELTNNLKVLVALRDDTEARDADRLHAIEIIQGVIVPRARPKEATTATVQVNLTPDQSVRAITAIDESGTGSSK